MLNLPYSPLIIFLRRFNSSSISSRKELNPPPALGAIAGAAEGDAPGALGGPLEGAAGGPGRFAKVGGCVTPPLGAEGGAPLPGAGGNLGAGGKPERFGGPPLEGEAGGDPLGGAVGGPPLGGAFGAPEIGGLGSPIFALVVVGVAGALPPLNKLNSVLAAAVLAFSVVGVAIILEEVLTVCTSDSITTSFKSFWALFSDFIKSLIPLTVSSRSSDKEVKPFFMKLITRSNFFCSFETKIYSNPLNYFQK